MNPESGPQLRDIHLPGPASWWPLAVGWWIAIAILLVAMGMLAFYLLRRRARRRRAEAPLRELDAIAVHWRTTNDTQAVAAALSQLLRRAARRLDPRSATLAGEAWLASLQAMAPRIPLFPLAAVEASIYQPVPSLDVDAAITTARRWLQHVMAQPAGSAPRA